MQKTQIFKNFFYSFGKKFFTELFVTRVEEIGCCALGRAPIQIPLSGSIALIGGDISSNICQVYFEYIKTSGSNTLRHFFRYISDMLVLQFMLFLRCQMFHKIWNFFKGLKLFVAIWLCWNKEEKEKFRGCGNTVRQPYLDKKKIMINNKNWKF